MVRYFLFVAVSVLSFAAQAGVTTLDFNQAITDTAQAYQAYRGNHEPVARLQENVLRPRFESKGFRVPEGQTFADVLYDYSLNSTSLNSAYFEYYMKYVEQNPTPERLANLSHSRATVLDNASAALLAMANRVQTKHPNLKPALETVRFPNTNPATPYLVYEWLIQLEALKQASPEEVSAVRERIVKKASAKNGEDYKRTPEMGGFKNGAGGNRVFQEALEFYIETNFVNPARLQRAQLSSEQVTRFTSMLADTDKALAALAAVERYATPTEVGKMRRASYAISEGRGSRVRCENLFR